MHYFRIFLLLATITGAILFHGCANQPADNQDETTDTLVREKNESLAELRDFMRALDSNVNIRKETKRLNDSETATYSYDDSELLKVRQTRDLSNKMEVNTYYLSDGQVVYAGYFTADKDCEGGEAYCLTEERYYFQDGKLVDGGQRSRIVQRSELAPGSEDQLDVLIKTVDFTPIDLEEVSGDYFSAATNEVRTLKLRGEAATTTSSEMSSQNNSTKGAQENTMQSTSSGAKKSSGAQGTASNTSSTGSEPKAQPFRFNDRGEASVSGRIKGGRTFSYMFTAEKDQDVYIDFDQLKGPGHFTVTTRGSELFDSHGAGSSQWSKRLARGGDYIVTVYAPEALAESEGDDVRYKIDISLQ